ncbi:MAG: cyclodeaminase/cyclohydrolase family protein [Clostridia bacterium]|nr:cyclodeaminase/cyclohydrolase family protein [Clostridia bacterium]
MDSQLKDMKVKVYLNALASDDKVPGGGSAAALAGSLAASLTSMVSNIVYDKLTDDPALKVDMKAYAQRAEHLRLMLEGCIEEDAKMFDLLMDAFNLPKDVEGRTERLQRALKNAAAVPMKIITLSCKVIELCNELYPQVKGLKISDCGTSAMLALAAINGGVLSVKINTYMIKDKEYAKSVNKQADDLKAKYGPMGIEIFNAVNQRISVL